MMVKPFSGATNPTWGTIPSPGLETGIVLKGKHRSQGPQSFSEETNGLRGRKRTQHTDRSSAKN